MPTYEYKCGACGHTFEAFQSIKADPLRDCPACDRSDSVKRLLSAGAGFIFKGSGFYITDYRSESYKQAAKNDAPPTASTTASGGAPSSASAGPTQPTAKSNTSSSTPSASPATKPGT